jgi:hypothetical protein
VTNRLFRVVSIMELSYRSYDRLGMWLRCVRLRLHTEFGRQNSRFANHEGDKRITMQYVLRRTNSPTFLTLFITTLSVYAKVA